MKIMFNKALVFAVIVLFIGVGFVLNIRGDNQFFGITLYVGGSGAGNYSSIQDAIDDSDHGDTIFVYNGTYNESIFINKTINLIGFDKDYTYIYGNNSDNVIYILANRVNISGFTLHNNNSGTGININFNNNTIDDIKIYDTFLGVELSGNGNIISRSWISFNDYGIELNGYKNSILDCDIISNLHYSISFCNSFFNTIFNSTINANEYGIIMSSANNILENTIYGADYGLIGLFSIENNISGNTIRDNENGIYLCDNSGNNMISNNYIYHNYCFGISIAHSNNNSIEKNNITNSFRIGKGIYLFESGKSSITDNTIFSNEEGIKLDESYNSNIYLNNIFQNDKGLCLKKSCENAIYWNKITNNDAIGISLNNSNFNNVYSNDIKNNFYGIKLEESSSNNIYQNNFIKNSYRHANFYDSYTCWTSNFWNRGRIIYLIFGKIPFGPGNIPWINIDYPASLMEYTIPYHELVH